jgi:hypothetical protein
LSSLPLSRARASDGNDRREVCDMVAGHGQRPPPPNSQRIAGEGALDKTGVTMAVAPCSIKFSTARKASGSYPELLIVIKIVNVGLETTRLLLPDRPISAKISSADCSLSSQVQVTVLSHLSGAPNVAMAPTWDKNNHPEIAGGETVVARKTVEVPCCAPVSGRESASTFCGFVDGQEDGQWWSGGLQDSTLEPRHGTCVVDRSAASKLMPGQGQFSALFLGDSQMRTSFQAVMGKKCADSGLSWGNHEYGTRTSTFGCDDPTIPFKSDSNRVLSNNICSGGFHTIGPGGCWTGGAAWQSHNHNHTVVYLRSTDVHDTRYVDQRWLATTSNVFVRRWFARSKVFDIVVVGSDLHDQNYNIIQYTDGIRGRLQHIRQWHKGPILVVGAWGISATRRGKGYAYAGSLAKAHAMAHAANKSAASTSGVWFVSLLDLTLNARAQTPDGVHLHWPFPMQEVAVILWHNIAYILSQTAKTLAT